MFIFHNSAQLYTVEFGKGSRTLVALGGWIGSWELWVEPLQILSRSWRTIAYDHRGTGATRAPVDSISLENMVADLFAILDRMNIENCVLAAESAGGMIAVEAVLRQPERFSGLVLVDAMLHRPADGSDAGFIQGLKINFPETIGHFVDGCVPEMEAHSQEIRAWGRKILERASPDSAVRLIECTYGVDLRPQLANIRIPTLILHGDHDVIVPVHEAEYAAMQIPYHHLHVIQGAGHVPTMTCAEEVAGQINQYFLQE